MIILDVDTTKKVKRLGSATALGPIELCHAAGEDPKTFFQNWDWTGADFSKGSVAGISFEGAVLDKATFLKGDLSDEQIHSTRSAEGIVWQSPNSQHRYSDATPSACRNYGWFFG